MRIDAPAMPASAEPTIRTWILKPAGSLPRAFTASSLSRIPSSTRPKGDLPIRRMIQAARTTTARMTARVASCAAGPSSDAKRCGMPGMPCTPFVSHRSLVTTRRTISEKPSVTMAK